MSASAVSEEMYIFRPIGPVISVSWSTGGARNVIPSENPLYVISASVGLY